MHKSVKHFVALVILVCGIGSNCLAQNKIVQPKSAPATKEIGAPVKVVVPQSAVVSKNAVVSKSAISAKVVADPKVVLAHKKVVELQKAALKEGISGMPVMVETPILPVLNLFDSVALVKNLKVKPYKVNAHASYYHDKLNGKRTASGKPFNNKILTAAHRTFPFGTQLKLTNTVNNKSVVVVVNDRGPFTKSREIDITKAAFMQIATNKNSGSVNITIEVVQ